MNKTMKTATLKGARFLAEPLDLTLLVLVILLTCFCSGCVVVPIAQSGRSVNAEYKKRASSLQTSAASREQVIRALGEPTMEFTDLRVLGYQWTGLEWNVYWVLIVGRGDAGCSETTIRRRLWLAFDDQNRLAHWQLTRQPTTTIRTEWEQARTWRESLSPPLSSPPPRHFEPRHPPSGKALVHDFWDQGHDCAKVMPVRVDAIFRLRLLKRHCN